MKISLILAHPNRDSFNHAIARTAAEELAGHGHEVAFHDLYAEEFDPALPLREFPRDIELPASISLHCREIAEADAVIVVHPNWWGMPPAILKGWIDRVMRPGAAYEFLDGDNGEGIPRGLLKAKTALVFNTANTLADREMAVFGDPLETIWKKCIFNLCGVRQFQRRTFGVIVTSSPEQRAAWLEEVRSMVRKTIIGS